VPAEWDNIKLREDYVNASIRSIDRKEGHQAFQFASFTFRNAEWQIDEEIDLRTMKLDLWQGIVNILEQTQ
jgi:hypothetical protein